MVARKKEGRQLVVLEKVEEPNKKGGQVLTLEEICARAEKEGRITVIRPNWRERDFLGKYYL